ncbi:5-(carboxyamino)imidazole ribonucleotide synthase [Bacteroidia bacterium]|nr:5-(carboxyamino)imidazole ribonucleotide synthase [Bacteroidia bacterium]MDB9882055.1 5-(carboxyamino)imidazole ribonucleotide synthase [Bacteroidia bacterium]
MKINNDKTIGVLGGGQLGKMLFEAGSPMNTKYVFLENTKNCPASLICNNQIVGSLQDENKIKELSEKSDVLTFEIEHVNVGALKKLESEGKQVIPRPSVLSIIQDKGLQKLYYQENNVPTLRFKNTTSSALAENIEAWPDENFVLKHRKGGYDGKGVQLLDKTEFNKLKENNDQGLLSDSGYVIEKLAKDAIEISVIVSVAQDGTTSSFEPCEMVFNPKSNLMDYLIAPSSLSDSINKECVKIAESAILQFQSPGLFAVELFVEKEGGIFVNEIAPRPHNSGHHTIESAVTSQYEQLNRILLNQPLGETSAITPAATCNIVGPENISGEYYIDKLNDILLTSGVYIHLYGKASTSPNRKLGHFTVLGKNREDVITKMEIVKQLLSIKSK